MSEPLLRIRNKHLLECGDPPIVNNDDPRLYVGYFETQLGEQWIYTFHRETRESMLYGGDLGWDVALRLHLGELEGVILEPELQQWSGLCWESASGTA